MKLSIFCSKHRLPLRLYLSQHGGRVALRGGQIIRQVDLARLSQAQAEGFYAVHAERPFYKSLVTFMTEGPVILMALQREDAVKKLREVMGATNPAQAPAAAPGQSVSAMHMVATEAAHWPSLMPAQDPVAAPGQVASALHEAAGGPLRDHARGPGADGLCHLYHRLDGRRPASPRYSPRR